MKKKTKTNSDKLKSQRRLNVQEQNFIRKERILKGAKYWRENGVPEPLEKVFKEKGIEIDKSVILEYEQDILGSKTDEGILLTPEGVFYEFEVVLNKSRTELIKLYSFSDVSERYKVVEHKKGFEKNLWIFSNGGSEDVK